jgi:hypothetical protein
VTFQPSHDVRFFDEPASRAAAIVSFVSDALDNGASAVVVARQPVRAEVEDLLTRAGYDIPALLRDGGVTCLDAQELLSRFMRAGHPDPDIFDEVIGGRVREWSGRSGGLLHVYGEMVDVLADDREFKAVAALETLWNDLAKQVPFRLLCGYSALNFTDPRTARALHTICTAHHTASPAHGDMLSEFVLRRVPQFHALPLAAR